jgi:Luciferase-like monooxygenase
MELGVHLPLMEFGNEGLSLRRLQAVVNAARESGFPAVSANDHFVFSTPWLDGPTALAAVIERSGDMTLATTISLVSLRGPVPLAKTLAALDLLSGSIYRSQMLEVRRQPELQARPGQRGAGNLLIGLARSRNGARSSPM